MESGIEFLWDGIAKSSVCRVEINYWILSEAELMSEACLSLLNFDTSTLCFSLC